MAKHSPTTATGPLRAALYLRVSSVGQEQDGTSLDTQEERDRAHAAAQGYAVDEGHVYREVYSGVELWERPKLTALREAIRHRAIDVVIVYAIDRLARDPVHLGVILSEAEHAGVAVDFVTEPLDYSPEGQLIRFVRGYAAKIEHEKIKERTMRGRLARVQGGKPAVGRKARYGYRWRDADKSGLDIEPTTAAIVQRMFRESAGGASLRTIAARLTAEGIPTPLGHARWRPATIREILVDVMYTGQAASFRYSRERVRGHWTSITTRPAEQQIPLPPGTVPALVDAATFEGVQERLRLNREQAPRNNRAPQLTLLRGGYARCGYCGGTMLVRRRPNERPPTYECGRGVRARGACSRHVITAPLLDGAVWGRVTTLLTHPETIRAEVTRMEGGTAQVDETAPLERALADIERQQRNLVDQLAHLGDSVAELVREKLAALDVRRQQLIAERATTLGQQQARQVTRDRLADLETWCYGVAANLESLTYEERRLALDALGVQVRIYRTDHTPRYEIIASVPLNDVAIVNETASRTAARTGRRGPTIRHACLARPGARRPEPG
jgi:site-specific DNA recombinase